MANLFYFKINGLELFDEIGGNFKRVRYTFISILYFPDKNYDRIKISIEKFLKEILILEEE